MKSKLLLLITFTPFFILAQTGMDCSDAVPAVLGLNTYDTISGNSAPDNCVGQYSNGSNGEWHVFTPTSNGSYTITTDLPSNSGGDTRFHLYSGSCGNLVCIGGDDDSGTGLLSVFSFTGTANVDYYIIFDNRWESTGRDFEIITNSTGSVPISFNQINIPSFSGQGRAVVDMNNDHLDDVVAISSTNININYQTSGGFSTSNFSTPSAPTPSWSLAAGDYDANGYNDLLYGNGSAVTFMQANNTGTGFTLVPGASGVFSQRSNFIDINNDGNLDAFVCHDVEPNVYFINDGSGNLTYYQTFIGAAPYVLGDDAAGGNYGSIWVDYDNDGDQDLFIAKCRGGNPTISVDEMYTNNGNGTFTENASTLNLADSMQTWSSAWGDFDNDGDMDVFVGASSGSHKLMRNDFNTTGQFIDVTATNNVAALSTTSIETTTYDLDNDGNLDLISGDNIFFGNGDMTFTLVTDMLSTTRRAFGDINNDGFIDYVPETGSGYLNSTNSNNWIKISTVGTASNINGIGARIELQTPSGTQIRDVRSGDGFRFMSTLNSHFGIGTETTINQITIQWPSGIVDTISNPSINQNLVVVEGSTLGVEDRDLSNLKIYPNPTQGIIKISTTENIIGETMTIFDVTGKKVLNDKLLTNTIDVSILQSGFYILRLESQGRFIERKFIKN